MVPSRVFVGVVAFGLIAALLVLTYAALILSGYEPPADSPYQLIFPAADGSSDLAWTIFLVIAGGMSLVFTFIAWRALLHGARRDQLRRRRQAELRQEAQRYRDQQRRGGPFN